MVDFVTTEDIKAVSIIESDDDPVGPAALHVETASGSVRVWFDSYGQLHDFIRSAMRDRDDGVLTACLEAKLTKETTRG